MQEMEIGSPSVHLKYLVGAGAVWPIGSYHFPKARVTGPCSCVSNSLKPPLTLRGLLNNLAWKSTGGHLSTTCPKVKLTINPASIFPHTAFCLLRPQIFNLLNYFSYILKYLQRLD